MASIRLKGYHHTYHAAGAVLQVTEDIAAALANLSLVTLDRAHALVTGGHAEWVEHPEALVPVPDPSLRAPEDQPPDPTPSAPAAAAELPPDPAPSVAEDAPAAEAPTPLLEPVTAAEPVPEEAPAPELDPAPALEPAPETEAAPQS